MIHDMTYAVQGALREERKFDVLSNHLANSSTTGFKSQTLSFDDMLQLHMKVNTAQGAINKTEAPLDVAISGGGYFKVETDHGVRYTRNGNFTLNSQGVLVTDRGAPVLSESGQRITIDIVNATDGGQVSIREDGEIEVDGTGTGKLALVDFVAPDRLRKEGDSLFAYDGPETDAITPVESTIEQGALEQSNVEVVPEMARMIEAHRFYESYQKLIQTVDDLNAKAVSEVGVVR